MRTIYFVSRVPCEHRGRLVEPIGIFATEAEAESACTDHMDCIVEVEVGKVYPLDAPSPIRTRYPLCPSNSGWQTSRGWSLAEMGEPCTA
jgi:hypothetical protein